jgi:hypothetical protein
MMYVTYLCVQRLTSNQRLLGSAGSSQAASSDSACSAACSCPNSLYLRVTFHSQSFWRICTCEWMNGQDKSTVYWSEAQDKQASKQASDQ